MEVLMADEKFNEERLMILISDISKLFNLKIRLLAALEDSYKYANVSNC